jgi:hypothetical protein
VQPNLSSQFPGMFARKTQLQSLKTTCSSHFFFRKINLYLGFMRFLWILFLLTSVCGQLHRKVAVVISGDDTEKLRNQIRVGILLKRVII